MRVFGREPVYLMAVIAITLKLLFAFGVNVGPDKQAWINAVAAAVVALISAIVLKTGAVGAMILNLAQAGLALFVGFGLHLTGDQQALLMSGVAAILALVLHKEVTAPVPSLPLEQTSPIEPAPPAPVAVPAQP